MSSSEPLNSYCCTIYSISFILATEGKGALGGLDASTIDCNSDDFHSGRNNVVHAVSAELKYCESGQNDKHTDLLNTPLVFVFVRLLLLSLIAYCFKIVNCLLVSFFDFLRKSCSSRNGRGERRNSSLLIRWHASSIHCSPRCPR